MSLLNINKKTKMIILTCWVILAAIVLTIVLISGGEKREKFDFSSFSTVSHDDYLNARINLKEVRKSSFSEENQDNHMESSQYNFEVLIGKEENEEYYLEVKYVYTIMIVETEKGEIIVKENKKGTPDSTSNQISKYSNNLSTITFNNLVKKQFFNTDSDVESVEQIPEKVGIDVTYKLVKTLKTDSNVSETINGNFKYLVPVIDLSEVNENVKKVETSYDESSKEYSFLDESYIENKLVYEKTSGSTTDLKVYNDKLTFTLKPNSALLGDKKIEHFSYQIYGILDNEKFDTENKFDDKILLAGSYGSLKNKFDDTVVEIDSVYNMKKIVYICDVKLNDGTTKTITYLYELQ